MRIVSYLKIKEFIKLHPNSETALKEWYNKTRKKDWHTLADIKQTFNNVDYVGNNRYIFNIRGNNYRLVAIIVLVSKKVYIRFIGTHKEYDKIDCKKI